MKTANGKGGRHAGRKEGKKEVGISRRGKIDLPF